MATLLLAFGALALAQVLDDPTITPAPDPSSTDVVLFPGLSASGPCKNVVCYDYINTCDVRWGTCIAACAGDARPTFSGKTCEGGKVHSSFSKSETEAPALAASAEPCGQKCDYRTDSCSNTFGPGCYTSCPGGPVPDFTTPVCETAPPVRTVVVTPVPVMSTMALMVPLEALQRRQAADTASSTSTDVSSSSSEASSSSTDALPSSSTTDAPPSSTEEASSSTTDVSSSPLTDASLFSTEASTTFIDASTTSTDASSTSTCFKGVGCDESSTSTDASATSPDFPVMTAGNGTSASNVTSPKYTPEPIPEGGATLGANLATIAPQSYGYLPVADIMDPPATTADVPAGETTTDSGSTATTVDDPQMLNSAIFSVQYASTTDVASSTESVISSPTDSASTTDLPSSSSTDLASSTDSASSSSTDSTLTADISSSGSADAASTTVPSSTDTATTESTTSSSIDVASTPDSASSSSTDAASTTDFVITSSTDIASTTDSSSSSSIDAAS